MNEKNSIYSKAVLFTIAAAVVILIGTVATVFVPLMMKDMHPKLADLEPYTPLELAGRNVYQREGCVNCHSQTVRVLKADVLRYGDYSKAGENYYEHPFLWGSKRTGPDLARIGMKYNDEWHREHFADPQAFYPLSDMPKYGWLENKKINVEEARRGMEVLGYPYDEDDIKELDNKTQLDALIAYMQVVGTAVEWDPYVKADPDAYDNATNPLTADAAVLEKGRLLYDANCFMCHGTTGQGTNIALGMNDLIDEDTTDGLLFLTIANGMRGMMPQHLNIMTTNDIWSLVAYCRKLAETQQQASN